MRLHSTFVTQFLITSAEDHVINSEQLPFVCQTIEVTTENEEQTVSSSHSYPLQISPVSSCCGETRHASHLTTSCYEKKRKLQGCRNGSCLFRTQDPNFRP